MAGFYQATLLYSVTTKDAGQGSANRFHSEEARLQADTMAEAFRLALNTGRQQAQTLEDAAYQYELAEVLNLRWVTA